MSAVILALCFAALVIESGADTCPAGEGYVRDDPTGANYGCQSCTFTNCENCLDYYDDTTCASGCVDTYGLTSDGSSCTPCRSNCFRCAMSVDTCTECYSQEDGPVLNGSAKGSCDSCAANCGDCKTSGAGHCDSCMSGFAFDNSTQPQCKACSPASCIYCGEKGPGKCDDCSTNYGADKDKNRVGDFCKLCESANCINCYSNYLYCDLCMGGMTTDTTTGQCQPNAPKILTRNVWGALPPSTPDPKVLDWRTKPVSRIIVHHTHNIPHEAAIGDCMDIIRAMQALHMGVNPRYKLKEDDLMYNFAICPGGQVLVGRGWNYVVHGTKSYPHDDSIHIALVGNFDKQMPTKAALDTLDNLIKLGKPFTLDPKTVVLGHFHTSCRKCPGHHLQKILEARSDYGSYRNKCGKYTRGSGHPSRK